jgi:uncharacterized protein YwgA
MGVKFSVHIKSFALVLLLLALAQCSGEDERVYFTSLRNGEFKARIVADSTLIFRSDRDNGSFTVPITYRAVLLDNEIDSLEWIFPKGDPTNVKESLSTTINYSKYGSYSSKLVLTKVDTLNLNTIVSFKDTIEITRPVQIAYKETHWNTFTTSDASSWAVLPNSQNVILTENAVSESTNPMLASAAFTGFEDQRLKFSVEYKLTYKNYLDNTATQNTKLEVLIDDLKAFGISRVTHDTYFTQEFYVDNLTDFNFIIKKYPAISTSTWALSLTQSDTSNLNIPLYDLVNQNKLIGYFDLTATAASSSSPLAYQALLQINLEGNQFNFGSNTGQLMKLDGDPISISPGHRYKIVFSLEDGLPKSYQLMKENFTTVPVNLEYNEYYLDASFRRLYISVD